MKSPDIFFLCLAVNILGGIVFPVIYRILCDVIYSSKITLYLFKTAYRIMFLKCYTFGGECFSNIFIVFCAEQLNFKF